MKVKEGKVERIRKTCPRCGEGTYMAEHKEKNGKVRYYCGKCKLCIWGQLNQ